MPPMEAMACGAALATYDNGGCRDYARDGETALVAPRRDVGALARALQRLVRTPPSASGSPGRARPSFAASSTGTAPPRGWRRF